MFFGVSVSAADVDYDKLNKQLGIMGKIIKTSVGDFDKDRGIKISSIQSTYLKHQGIVFTLSTSSRYGSWGDYGFNIPAIAPIPAEEFTEFGDAMKNTDVIKEMNLEETVERAMEAASHGYALAIEQLNNNRGLMRDLHEDKRDLEYELRDIERDNRDIEFQLRRADKDKKSELEKAAKKLEKRKKALLEEREAIASQVNEYSKKRGVELKKREQARGEYFNSLSQELAETLCLYGNGLKSLPKGEYVTVILQAGGERHNKDYKDKIHVFSKRDINGCAVDKISSAQLLEKSSAYNF